MKIAVAFTAYQRPQYFQQTLLTWARAEGASEVPALLSLEPSPVAGAMEKLFFATPFSEKIVVENAKVEGPLTNPWLAVDRAIAAWDPDFIIIAEEDSVVAADVLDYFRWTAETTWDDEEIVVICSFQNDWLLGSDREVVRRQWFSPTIWGIQARKWAWLRENWDHDYTHRGWDHRIYQLMIQDGKKAVFPVASRSNHIGEVGGAHMLPEYWESSQAHRFLDGDIPTGKWTEVEFDYIRSQG